MSVKAGGPNASLIDPPRLIAVRKNGNVIFHNLGGMKEHRNIKKRIAYKMGITRENKAKRLNAIADAKVADIMRILGKG